GAARCGAVRLPALRRSSLCVSEPKERSPEFPAEPRPALCPLRGGDVRALAVKLEDLEKVRLSRCKKIPVRRRFLVRKYQPRETKKTACLLVARPAFPRTAGEPLRFSGRPSFTLFSEGCEEILPHHVLGSLQELKMEALARGNTQVDYKNIADFIQVPHQHVAAVLKEERGGETKRKSHQTAASEHKALQNWHRNMAIRKKQERYLGEILQKPENELLMSISEDYRQIQEERDLIDRSLPGYRAGSEFWSQPERIGDELTGLTVTLTRRERGCPEPVTHVGKPHTVQMETGKEVWREQQDEVIPPSSTEAASQLPSVGPAVSTGDEVGIAARLTFETVVGEKAESFLTVSNDGTAAVWYNWRRLLPQIPSRGTTRMRMRCFYFDARPGVILPGQSRTFFFLFKSERAGIFSESWEFRTHPLLLGGALLQVTLWGIAVCEDKLADLRGKLEADLAAQEGAAVVEETLKDLLVQIRTPERTPSPAGAYATEEELFHRKNPKVRRAVQRLHELCFQPPRNRGDLWCVLQRSTPALLTAPSVLLQRNPRERPRGLLCAEEKRTRQRSGYFKLLPYQLSVIPELNGEAEGWEGALRSCFLSRQALKSIPQEEQREAALSQLNKAVLELCAEQRPTQSDLLYQTCLQLWREAVDGLVGRSLRLRSQLGLPEREACVEAPPEGGGEWWLQHSRRIRGLSERPTSRKSKVKEKKKLKTGSSSEKERAQPAGAAATDAVTPPREQADPIVWGLYQEKLYVEVSPAKVCTFVSGFCSLLIS
uniref:MYCBP associated protein n=1 Tax=Pavo cristatus TaxID=9049 RepID=A0A8C9GCQ9_PAVCR